MRLRKRLPVPESLVASATQVASAAQVKSNVPAWNSYRLRDENWQIDTWRFYDIIGEFRFAANYIASACSRVRMYVAEVDELGRIGDETGDEEIQAVADTLFGNIAEKSEKLRAIGVSLTVAGECFVIGKAGAKAVGASDKWFVVAPSELRRFEGGMYFKYNNTRIELNSGRDIVYRVWTPHPARPDNADSPGRSALPVLNELEQLTHYVESQIDSRLAGAGLLPIPSDLEFPATDENPGGRVLMEARQ